MDKQYGLRDCVGQVEAEDSGRDNTIKGGRADEVEQAIQYHKNGGGEGGTNGEIELFVDVRKVARERQSILYES